MNQFPDTQTERKVEVPPGLSVLRYASSSAERPPYLLIRTLSGSRIDVFFESSDQNPELAFPGQCCVIRASAKGQGILVSVLPSHPGGSRNAELTLETLSTSPNRLKAPSPAMSLDSTPPSNAINVPSLRMTAHVAHRGDVGFNQGQWVCGPDLPMPIEGMRIDCDTNPAHLDAEIIATSYMRGATKENRGGFGSFVGTRGKSAPIVRLELTLSGQAASRLQFIAEALFLGSTVQSATGPNIVFAGLTGREPLVGFKLAIAEKRVLEPQQMQLRQDRDPPIRANAALALEPSMPEVRETSVAGPAQPSSQLRSAIIFRSSRRQNTT
jgi:hypothetical protein